MNRRTAIRRLATFFLTTASLADESSNPMKKARGGRRDGFNRSGSATCLEDAITLPSFAEGHGCKPVDECEVGTLRSLGARPSQPKRLLRRSRQGGYASDGCAL